jgi:hypothetical protein
MVIISMLFFYLSMQGMHPEFHPVEDGILHVLLRKCCKRKLMNRHHHNTNNLSSPDNFFGCQELTISFLHPDTVHSPNLGGIQVTGNERISDLR